MTSLHEATEWLAFRPPPPSSSTPGRMAWLTRRALDGAALPFADGSFDLVVAYNSLQVVADLPGTVHRSARVLNTGGHFSFCVSHPVTDVGRFDGDGPEASFMVRDRLLFQPAGG